MYMMQTIGECSSITDMASDESDTNEGTGATVWLSTDEAARQLGVNSRTVYRFIDDGGLTAYRFGRVIRLKDAAVAAFEESCRIQPGSLSHLVQE